MSRMKRKIMRDGMLGGKTMLRSVAAMAAMAAALASLAFLAGPAQAYDEGDCPGEFAAPFIVDVDRVKASSGSVDFGDGWHLGGSPWGDAVVCWSGAGNVVVKGRLYADSSTPIEASVSVTFFHNNGTTSTLPRYFFVGKDGQNRFINYGSQTGTVNKVRIRLHNCGNYPNVGTCQLVSTITSLRGD